MLDDIPLGANLFDNIPLGTRLTVRSRIDSGFRDALGYLRAIDDTNCVIETKRGLTTVPLIDVVAVKRVPPPPAPRPRLQP